MGKKQDFVFVVIPLSEIKKFFMIDIVGGTVLYYAIKLPLHSAFAGFIGSMAGPILIRQSINLARSTRLRHLTRKSNHVN